MYYYIKSVELIKGNVGFTNKLIFVVKEIVHKKPNTRCTKITAQYAAHGRQQILHSQKVKKTLKHTVYTCIYIYMFVLFRQKIVYMNQILR